MERHTAQGRARGQRWGTLDREADGIPHGPDEIRSPGSHAVMNERDLAEGRRGGTAHVTGHNTIAAGGCWCGQHQDHDWPGRDAGAPHPRPGTGSWQEAARRLPGGRS
jgi:hypothetical protein